MFLLKEFRQRLLLKDPKMTNSGTLKTNELLPETDGQSDVMTIADGPGTITVECGHWYSPAAVKRMIELARGKEDDALNTLLESDSAD